MGDRLPGHRGAVILGAETVTVVRPPGTDDWGDPIPGSGTETAVEGCMVQPRTSTELVDGHDTVIIGFTVWMPPGTDVQPTDLIRYLGREYAVNGQPFRWRDFDGIEDHVQVELETVSG